MRSQLGSCTQTWPPVSNLPDSPSGYGQRIYRYRSRGGSGQVVCLQCLECISPSGSKTSTHLLWERARAMGWRGDARERFRAQELRASGWWWCTGVCALVSGSITSSHAESRLLAHQQPRGPRTTWHLRSRQQNVGWWGHTQNNGQYLWPYTTTLHSTPILPCNHPITHRRRLLLALLE